MAIDPGATVGWSIGKGIKLEEYGNQPADDFLWTLKGKRASVERVVVERFDIRQITNDTLHTVKLIGKIEYICNSKWWPLVYINASDKKKFIEQAKVATKQSSHAADAEALRLYDFHYGSWR